MNPNQIFEDFERKYQGSFIQVAINNQKPQIYQFRTLRHKGTKFPELELQSDLFGTIILNYNTQAKILFKIPQTGYIQHGQNALLFARIPARQWKRGIHQGNCSFDNPLKQYGLRRNDDSQPCFTKIRAAFNPVYYSLHEAIQMLASKKYQSVVLSRNMALSTCPKANLFVLWYRYAAIGTVTPNGQIDAPTFMEEIRREVR